MASGSGSLSVNHGAVGSNRSSKESSISVVVRVRPFTESERLLLEPEPKEQPVFLGDGALSGQPQPQEPSRRPGKGKTIRRIVDTVDDRMLIFDPASTNPMNTVQKSLNAGSRIREHKFVFDRLFNETASQYDVYQETAKPLLDNVLDGYNATVFAYGATGCGKTHTISGTPEDLGLIFLTMRDLFDKIGALKDTKIVEVGFSYLEIYNETIRDLLNPEGGKPLILREDADRQICVSNLTSHTPENVDEVMEMIVKGNVNRTMSPTEANAVSSRSHAVIQINITQKSRTASLVEAHTFATLSVIDLAGSERASATKNKGHRLFEGANINKSLLALGNCINVLCQSAPGRTAHVPYRDSKLTRLLKFSLGGNCKTVMIVCISPSSQHYDETLNTLKYADRAKNIKTKVVRNQRNLDRHVGSYLKMITEQKQEIEELRAREATIARDTLARFDSSRQKCVDSMHEAMRSLKNASSVDEIESITSIVGRRLKSLPGWTAYDSEFLDTLIQLRKLEVQGFEDESFEGSEGNQVLDTGAFSSSAAAATHMNLSSGTSYSSMKRVVVTSPRKIRAIRPKVSLTGSTASRRRSSGVAPMSPSKRERKRVRFDTHASIRPLEPVDDNSENSTVTVSDSFSSGSDTNISNGADPLAKSPSPPVLSSVSTSSLTKRALTPRVAQDKENIL